MLFESFVIKFSLLSQFYFLSTTATLLQSSDFYFQLDLTYYFYKLFRIMLQLKAITAPAILLILIVLLRQRFHAVVCKHVLHDYEATYPKIQVGAFHQSQTKFRTAIF